MDEKRIMLVDDDVLLRELAAEFLEDEGYEVVQAADADVALAVLRLSSNDFHVLVTDVRMPGNKDGLELAAYAREAHPDLGVVVVSGYAAQLSERLNRLPQPHTFLPKPFHLTELGECVDDVMPLPLGRILSNQDVTDR